MTKKRAPVVFISYSSIDRGIALILSERLSDLGVRVWIDVNEVLVGHDFTDKIYYGLTKAKFIIVVLTKNSANSKWVKEELSYSKLKMIDKKQRLILPLLFEDCEIPPQIKTLRYADFRKNFVDGFNDLAKSLGLDARDLIPKTFWSMLNAIHDSSRRKRTKKWMDRSTREGVEAELTERLRSVRSQVDLSCKAVGQCGYNNGKWIYSLMRDYSQYHVVCAAIDIIKYIDSKKIPRDTFCNIVDMFINKVKQSVVVYTKIDEKSMFIINDIRSYIEAISTYFYGNSASSSPIELMRAFQEEDWELRWQAAIGTKKLGSEAAIMVPILIEHLDDVNDDVRWESTEALRSIGTLANKATPYLLKRFNDSKDKYNQEKIQIQAIDTLSEIASPEACRAIIEIFMQEKDVNIKKTIMYNFKYCKELRANCGREIINYISDANYLIRTNALKLINEIVPTEYNYIPILTDCLRDNYFEVRAISSSILGRIGSKNELKELEILENDTYLIVRDNASIAVKNIKYRGIKT